MELEELKAIWSDHDRTLHKNLKLNMRILNEINVDKAKSKMRKLMIRRVIEALLFFAMVLALGAFIAKNLDMSMPTISAFMLNVFAIIGLAGSIGQIALAGMVDYSGPVSLIQRQLAQIKSHGIQVFKLLILSVPFYLSYIFLGFELLFGIDLYAMADSRWIILNVIISFFLIIPTLWLYKQLGQKPTKHKWVKSLIEDIGGKQVAAAVEFLGEIDEFKKEEI